MRTGLTRKTVGRHTGPLDSATIHHAATRDARVHRKCQRTSHRFTRLCLIHVAVCTASTVSIVVAKRFRRLCDHHHLLGCVPAATCIRHHTRCWRISGTATQLLLLLLLNHSNVFVVTRCCCCLRAGVSVHTGKSWGTGPRR